MKISYFLSFIALFLFISPGSSCKKNTDCMKTCYKGQDLCYMQHTFPGESDEGFCDGGTFFKSGRCKKKKSLNEKSCKNDNNFCVTRLCNNNQCKHRTSGCASVADCVGAATQGLGDFFNKETSTAVAEFVEKDSSTVVEDITQNCETPTGGSHCPEQPCNGYGKLRKKNSRRRLSDIELTHEDTPGKLISRKLLEKIHSNVSHYKRRELQDALEKIKTLLSKGLVIEKNVDTCHYIIKENQFVKPNHTCVPQDTSGYWFHRKVETNSCRDKECTAKGDIKMCVKGPVYFSLTPNFKFDLTTFNFGVGAGFLFDASKLSATITTTGEMSCIMDRDWTLTDKVTLFKKPVQFGAVSIMIEISGQVTARVHGELNGQGSAEMRIDFEEIEIADSFQVGLNMEKSEDNCLNMQDGVSDVAPPTLPKTGPNRLRMLKQRKCNEGRTSDRLLMSGIFNKNHRRLLDISFKPVLKHIKSSGKTIAKLTASVQGEFTLMVNGVQAEVGIGGDASIVAEAYGETNNAEACTKASANVIGGLKIGTYIPSFDLVETIANFGQQQCSQSLGIIDKLRRRRLKDDIIHRSIFERDEIDRLSNSTREWLDRSDPNHWHMKVIRANRKLRDRYGHACNSKYSNRKDVVKKELKTFTGRNGICRTMINFGLEIIGNPKICVNEYANCDVLHTMSKIELGQVNDCGGEGVITIPEYTCEPFKTHVEEEYKSSCLSPFDWILFLKIMAIVLPILCCCCGIFYYVKK